MYQSLPRYNMNWNNWIYILVHTYLCVHCNEKKILIFEIKNLT